MKFEFGDCVKHINGNIGVYLWKDPSHIDFAFIWFKGDTCQTKGKDAAYKAYIPYIKKIPWKTT